MTTEGVDYAFTLVDERALYAAGKRFAMRYVGPGSNSKHLHALERDRIWAAGLSIVLLSEGTALAALGGTTAGARDGLLARSAATTLGAPATTPIYPAVDFDVTASQWPLVADYLRGYAGPVGAAQTGIYGGIRAMQWAARDQVAAWFFQTYAWSSGAWYAGNHVEQYHNGVSLAGGTVDLCRAKVAAYGQWGPPGTPTPTPPEDDMRSVWYLRSAGRVLRYDGTFWVQVGTCTAAGVMDGPALGDIYTVGGRWGESAPMVCDGPLKMTIMNRGLHMNSEPYLTLIDVGDVAPGVGGLGGGNGTPVDLAAVEAAAEEGAHDGIEGATIHTAP